MVRLDSLLAPIPGENPSGIELRHDPDFQKLADALKPQVEVVRDNLNNPIGSSVIPTDWVSVLAQAKELAQRGRDLRLLVIILQAEFHANGFNGLVPAIDLLTDSVSQFWDTLHPGLRGPSDKPESALGRKNALAQIENENDGLIGDILAVSLFATRDGEVTGKDLATASMTTSEALSAAATGQSAKEKEKLRVDHESLTARINKATRNLAENSSEEIIALSEGVAASLSAVAKLESAVNGSISGKIPFRLPKLTKLLTQMQATLDQAIKSTEAGQKTAPDETVKETISTTNRTTSRSESPSSKVNGGVMPEHLKSREDVARVLGLVVDFYERTEPSSPIPHLARRLQKMVPMNFVELMEEIAPGGLKDFKNVAGIGSDKS